MVSGAGHGAAEDIPSADVFRDARWFPESYDSDRNEFRFVSADRETIASQTFLDGRWNRTRARHTTAAIESILDNVPREKPRLNFIWHTGFCCSTLLAKALDRRGVNLSLCEPQIVVEIADAKRAGKPRDALPALVFRLLARGFSPQECVTLKPAPAANCLAREAAASTDGKMLFLYSDCRSFLVSITKMGEEGRKYVRRMFLAIAGDGHDQVRWQAGKLLSLSDLEMAATVWHMQIVEMRRHWQMLGAARAASLNCDALLANPVEVLSGLDTFFELGVGQQALAEVASGPLFRRNAKTAEASFDANTRREEHARIAESLGGDLDRVVRESYALCGVAAQDAPLPNALVAIS
jgi:hypothetical protein